MIAKNKKKSRNLSLFQLSILVWTLTCAGPFGIEAAFQNAGAFYTFIGLIVTPFIYSIPQSLMCSELGSMMPSHHGYIIWVYRAFDNNSYIGNFIGFFNAIGDLMALGSDIPIYTVLMSFYFELLISTYFKDFIFTFWTSYLFKLFMVIIGAIFNIFNITTLGNSSIIFSVIILLPFIIGFSYSIPNINVEAWTNTKPYNDSGEYQWGLFLSSMIWLHCGWDSVGSLTAELNFPKSEIFLCFVFGIILDFLSYVIPVIGALTVKCDDNCWDDGYLYTAYDKIIPHLGIFVVISGFISSFSLYIAELAVQARSFWALSQPKVLLIKSGEMIIEGHNDIYYDDEMNIINISDYYDKEFNMNEEIELKHVQNDDNSASKDINDEEDVELNQLNDKQQSKQELNQNDKDLNQNNNIIKTIKIGIFPQWLCGTKWAKTGAPVRGVLLQSVISSILILFDFEALLAGTMLVASFTWSLEFISFVILRYTEPDTDRPFKVPGGMFIAWLITIDKIILVIILTVLIIYDDVTYLYLLCGYTVIVTIWYVIYSCNWKNNIQKKNNNLEHV
jgi:amino acid transporter